MEFFPRRLKALQKVLVKQSYRKHYPKKKCLTAFMFASYLEISNLYGLLLFWNVYIAYNWELLSVDHFFFF